MATDEFKNRLASLREEKKLTQVEFSKIMGYTRTAVCNWEGGNRQPRLDDLVKIADFFGVSVDYLVGRTDYRNGKIYKLSENGQEILIDVDLKKYPYGLTHEQVMKILENVDHLNKIIGKADKEHVEIE